MAMAVSLLAFEAKSLPVNTEGIERMPWLHGDTLYFVAGSYDIYCAERLADGSWGPREPVPGEINTEANEISPCIVERDGTLIMYFARYTGTERDYDFFRAVFDPAEGLWKNPVMIPELSTETQEWDIWVSNDETVAYLTTKGKFGDVEIVGKRDVWKSVKVDGKWSLPVLAREVSTDGDEWSVFVDPLGRVWVDGARSDAYGSYDIYYYDPSLSLVIHVEKDVNSIYNERSVWTDGKILIFTSADRNIGMGGYDIYITDLGEE
jgi:hypothetical protein